MLGNMVFTVLNPYSYFFNNYWSMINKNASR